MGFCVCLHTHQNPELSRLCPNCLFYRADAVNTVHFFAALFTNLGNTIAGNIEVFTNAVFTNVGNTLAGNIEVFPKAVFTKSGNSPFYFAKVFSVVQEEVQEVEGSGLTPGKCPLEGATELICTLAANGLVLLPFQRESIETVKPILRSPSFC